MQQMEVLREATERLGVAHKEKAPRSQRLRDTGNHRSSGLKRQVHGYVAAEDHIESIGPPEPRIIFDQVAFFEAGHRLDGAVENKLIAFLAKVRGAKVRRSVS